jgi:hypothetical protein
MRIIKELTLTKYCRQSKYRKAEEPVKAWV